jgi:hypothetical protein
MPRPRWSDLGAVAAALLGAALAVEGHCAGSLFRYQLAGYAAGTLLALPLLTLLLWREAARRTWRRLWFAALPLTALLLLAEFGLRLLGPAHLAPEILREDPRLGHALVPGVGTADANGFRNPTALLHAEVLCVGDSQTWGFHVGRDAAYPARLGSALQAPVYQMALGGYGPVQYRELVRQGLALQPRLVVIGFYFGNDLLDAVDYAGLPGAADLRAPGQPYPPPRSPELDGRRSPNTTMALVDALLDHSRLLGSAANVVKSRLQGGRLDAQPGAVPFDAVAPHTILLPGYRLPTVDPNRPHVQDGLRITGQCLRDIAAACRTAGARCVMLAIPTKEYVYAEWRHRAGGELPDLAALRAAEAHTRSAVFAAAAAAGVDVLDLAPGCQSALAAGTAPWPANGDGHLDTTGHQLAADLLAAWWRAQ